MKFVRKVTRRDKAHWIVDIRYRALDGTPRRYRRDAQVQTRSAAQAEAKRLLVRLAETGTLEGPEEPTDEEDPPTVGDAVDHFKLVELPKKKPSTQRGYQVILDSEVLPRFEELPLAELDRGVFIRTDTELAEAGLSASTRRNVLVVLRRVLRSAVDAGWMEQMPHLPQLPRVGRSVARAMSWAEAEAIIAAGNTAFRLSALLARDAGLRASEVRGLRWSDVDLPLRALTVRRAICRGVEAPPKSGHERNVPLTDELYEELLLREKRKDSPWSPVAPSSRGTVWSEAGLRSAFRSACEKAGIEGWRFHDLRHFFVTHLFRHGASAPVVQRLAGHEVLTTTQRYAHADEDECRAAIAAFGNRRMPGRT